MFGIMPSTLFLQKVWKTPSKNKKEIKPITPNLSRLECLYVLAYTCLPQGKVI